jgi:hypothetical protein
MLQRQREQALVRAVYLIYYCVTLKTSCSNSRREPAGDDRGHKLLIYY